MDTLFIFGAKYLFLLSIAIAGIYFLFQPFEIKKRMVIFAIIALPIIGIIAFAGNHFYNNPRPFVVGNFQPLIPHAADNGFPSDHTLLTAAIAAIVFFFNRRVGVVLAVIAVLVGISRVYTGLHHPIDIIGSIVIAAIGAVAASLVLKKRTSQY